MGIFFQSHSLPSPQLERAIENALRTSAPTVEEADRLAAQAVDQVAPAELRATRGPKLQSAIRDAYLRTTPSAQAAPQIAREIARDAASDAKKERELMPQWAAFVGAAVIFGVLIAVTTYVAGLADAQATTV